MMVSQMNLGAICSPKDVRDYKGVCATTVFFPEEYECYVPAVKNQGSVGSCVAHSLAEVMEVFNHAQENKDVAMSTGYIYGNRKNSTHKGYGMIVRHALGAVVDNGTTTYKDFPYNIEVPDAINKFNESELELDYKAYPNRISSYYSIPSDDVLKAALMNGDAVIFVIPWFRDIRVVDGVIQTEGDETKINGYHCMIIYGWNKDGWLIQNSWGTHWGKEGRAILPYTVVRSETWGIKDTISNMEGKKEWVQKAKYEIDTLELTLVSLGYTIDELEKQLLTISDSLKEDLKKEIESKINEVDDIDNKIRTLKLQISETEKDLVDIKKPFNFVFGDFIAKIINFILRYIFKK